MCRWAAYLGAPIFLEEIITLPKHSLIAQSFEATECKTATNGDGFGIAWYGAREEPGLYRDVYPAWSDPNLKAIAHHVQSGLFLSHVRASTGSCISRNNCHPFAAKTWSFMHNGQVGGFENFRKTADMAIEEAYYAFRKGSTDSEVLFLLAMGFGMDTNPIGAMERAVGHLEKLSRDTGVTPHMRLSSAFSDGSALYAARYSSDHIAPSVYYRFSEKRQGWAVVSEPLEADEDDWTALAPGKILKIDADGAQISDFKPS